MGCVTGGQKFQGVASTAGAQKCVEGNGIRQGASLHHIKGDSCPCSKEFGVGEECGIYKTVERWGAENMPFPSRDFLYKYVPTHKNEDNPMSIQYYV